MVGCWDRRCRDGRHRIVIGGDGVKADKKLMEQIVKTAVNYNGQEVEFDKKFLSLMENYELQVEDRGDSVVVRTRMKEGV